jgi:hypothetical protein
MPSAVAQSYQIFEHEDDYRRTRLSLRDKSEWRRMRLSSAPSDAVLNRRSFTIIGWTEAVLCQLLQLLELLPTPV